MRRFCALLGAIPTCAVLGAILAAGFCLPAGDADARQREAVAKDARLAGDRARTRFIADLSKKVEVNVFSLADPYRVIVDLPELVIPSYTMLSNANGQSRGSLARAPDRPSNQRN